MSSVQKENTGIPSKPLSSQLAEYHLQQKLTQLVQLKKIAKAQIFSRFWFFPILVVLLFLFGLYYFDHLPYVIFSIGALSILFLFSIFKRWWVALPFSGFFLHGALLAIRYWSLEEFLHPIWEQCKPYGIYAVLVALAVPLIELFIRHLYVRKSLNMLRGQIKDTKIAMKNTSSSVQKEDPSLADLPTESTSFGSPEQDFCNRVWKELTTI